MCQNSEVAGLTVRSAALVLVVSATACGLDVVGTAGPDAGSVKPVAPALSPARDAGEVAPDAGPPDADAASVPAGKLTAAIETITTTTDLTAEGVIDWVHWGYLARTDGKPGGTSIARTPTLGPEGVELVPDNEQLAKFHWDSSSAGADPVDTYSYGGLRNRNDMSFEVTIDASTTERTARFYLGGRYSQIRFTVALADGSAAPPTELTAGSVDSGYMRRFVVVFASGGPSKLVARCVVTSLHDTGGSLRYAAVTLQSP